MHVDLVDCGSLDVGRVEHERVGVVIDPHPVQLEQVAHDLDIADPGYVVQPAGTVGQQRGDHGLGHEVLGAAYPDLAP